MKLTKGKHTGDTPRNDPKHPKSKLEMSATLGPFHVIPFAKHGSLRPFGTQSQHQRAQTTRYPPNFGHYYCCDFGPKLISSDEQGATHRATYC